ncbi:MAG: L,D-transpeptidase [Clostridia bacterium]|nr:L,D-transpeptidase [Clostridia bacterium]
MANRKSSRARQRRLRKARNCLLMLTLLALLVCAVWTFVIKPSGPLNAFLQSRIGATSVPTEAPTDAPTAVPTDAPTAEPTEAPTDTPTAVPTEIPTEAPTAEPTATPEPTAEPVPVDLELPYYIEVDRGMQVVRVYTIGEDGHYSLLVRQMICSTDRFGYKPKDGVYELDGQKMPWLITLVPDNYAQYATRISRTILFHSVTYSLLYPDTLNKEAYEQLGQNVSAGCVRLLAEDAKWIYDNVPAGTPVRFMSGNERDEELLKQLAPPPLKSGKWDPTDPRENNPDYDPSYAASKPQVTAALGVTPAPTEAWVPMVHQTPAP